MTTRTQPIHAWFESSTCHGGTEHRVVLENVPALLGEARQTIFWRAIDCPNLDLPPVLDSYVCSLALIAARADRDLVVHAPMSRTGLFNLGQLLSARNALNPYKYPRIGQVVPDRVVEFNRPIGDPGLAVAAVSGGLDSTFTLMRHAMKLEGAASHKLSAAIMVHGFDAAPENHHQFALMRERARPIAERAGLPLYTVVTNIRHLDHGTWPDSAIPHTANALAMFSARHAYGVVSAGAPYNALRLGMSHPPVLDELASNAWFTVITDGGELGRADKIEHLRRYPDLIDRLKVCWEGPDPSRNCGVCRKCILTRLNLIAVGIENAACFDGPLDPAMVRTLHWRNTFEARDFFTICWNELELRGVRGPAVNALRDRLARVPPDMPNFVAWFGRQIHRIRALIHL